MIKRPKNKLLSFLFSFSRMDDETEVRFRKGDLFTSTDDAIAHCVSRDFAMGAGVAKGFRTKFGRVDELKAQRAKIGQAAFIDTWNKKRMGTQTIFYMVTKEKYNDKPTFKSVRLALTSVREGMLEMGLESLSMPMIAAGLDRLSWPLVLREIEDVFQGTGIVITIWYLK